MGLFNAFSRSGRDSTPSSLADDGWRGLSVRTTHSISLFILRPLGEQGKRFEKNLSALRGRLEETNLTEEQFASTTHALEATCSEFAVAQRADVERLIADLGEAVEETLAKFAGSIDAAAEPVQGIEKVRQSLTVAQKSDSLEETRRLLSESVASLKKLATDQLDRERGLRSEYQAQAKKLSARLQQVHQESRTDSLTELPNRRSFEEYCAEIMDVTPGNRVTRSLCMMDLDGFKALNDTFGHAAGDAALATFAKRLRKAVGDKPFISRLGGDEFVMIAPITEPVLRGLLTKLGTMCGENPCFHEDRRMTIRFSFGIVEFDCSRPIPEVAKEADKALYEFKQARKAKRAA